MRIPVNPQPHILYILKIKLQIWFSSPQVPLFKVCTQGNKGLARGAGVEWDAWEADSRWPGDREGALGTQNWTPILVPTHWKVILPTCPSSLATCSAPHATSLARPASGAAAWPHSCTPSPPRVPEGSCHPKETSLVSLAPNHTPRPIHSKIAQPPGG